MWRLFAAFGYKGWRYDNEGSTDVHLLPLDPIDVAGKASLGDLLVLAQRHHILFAEHALKVISDLKYFLDVVKPPINRSRFLTPSVYEEHLKCLVEWKVYRNVEAGVPLHFARYFAVPKASVPPVARTIFNGASFSKSCQVPPPIHLPDVAVVLKFLADTFRGRKYSAITADIRHWFHQIRLHADISKYFGLCYMKRDSKSSNLCRRIFLLANVLPMGWSWSPFIAQSLSFLLLLETARRCGLNIDAYTNCSELPPFLCWPNFVIILWYDNVGVFGADENLVRQFYRQLKAVFNEFSVILKEGEFYTAAELQVKESDPSTDCDPQKDEHRVASYLGLEFGWRGKRQRGGTIEFVWRHLKKKTIRWATYAKRTPLTPRDVAAAVGIAVWDCHISLRSLLHIEADIELLRLAGSAARRSSWDTADKQLNTEVKSLDISALLDRVLGGAFTWRTSEPTPSNEVIIASDASKLKWAYLIYKDGFIESASNNGFWNANLLVAHIFVKELTAAIWAIEKVLDTTTQPTRIIIATDNSATAAVLRRMYSTTAIGRELTQRIMQRLADQRCVLEVIQVKSEENPSDAPTRSKPVNSELSSDFLRSVDRWRVGQQYLSPSTKRPTPGGCTLRSDEATTAASYISDPEDDEVEAELGKMLVGLRTSPDDDCVDVGSSVNVDPSE